MKNLLKLLPAETAHNLGKWLMKSLIRAPGVYQTETSQTVLFDTPISNPLGLAAGFDKNGDLVDVISRYGFGFSEVGSVTLQGGRGNKRPRLFRLDHENLLNRMGLNGEPAEVVCEKLKQAKGIFGVSVAKTHSPDIMGDAAFRDVLGTYKLVKELGVYTTLNVSCPNTKEGKTFEDPSALCELLAAIKGMGKGKPLVVKLSPVALLSDDGLICLNKTINVCEDMGVVDGYVVSNTSPAMDVKCGKGGISGPVLRTFVPNMIRHIRERAPNKWIIAVGGITNGKIMHQYDKLGATVFQAYTGFVHGENYGPDFAHVVLREWEKLKHEVRQAN